MYKRQLAGLRRRAAVCVALLLISGLAEVFGIGALLPLLSSNLNDGAGRTGWLGLSGDALAAAAVCAFLAFGLVAALVRYLAQARIAELFAAVEQQLRSRMVTVLLRTRWTDYLQITLGEAVKAANHDGARVARGVEKLVQGLGSGMIAVVFLGGALVIEPLMTCLLYTSPSPRDRS